MRKVVAIYGFEKKKEIAIRRRRKKDIVSSILGFEILGFIFKLGRVGFGAGTKNIIKKYKD
jgi:hypothetical protein